MGDYDYLFKVLVIGEAGVGKTSLLSRLCDREFTAETQPTIGVDFRIHFINLDNGKRVKLQLWDTAGHERYRTMTESYYRNAHGILLVYDLTNAASFDAIRNFWLNEVELYNPDAVKMVIGNKQDLVISHREVTTDDNLDTTETSAKLGQVDQVFKRLSEKMIQEYSANVACQKRPQIVIEHHNLSSRLACCY